MNLQNLSSQRVAERPGMRRRGRWKAVVLVVLILFMGTLLVPIPLGQPRSMYQSAESLRLKQAHSELAFWLVGPPKDVVLRDGRIFLRTHTVRNSLLGVRVAFCRWTDDEVVALSQIGQASEP